MSINGKRDGFTIVDLLTIGSKVRYKNSKIEIQQVLDVVSNWSYYAKKKVGIPSKQGDKLQKSFRTLL